MKKRVLIPVREQIFIPNSNGVKQTLFEIKRTNFFSTCVGVFGNV